MKKGISTIIAAIILVVITIGLIATAYLYFSGIVTVGPVIALAAGYCTWDSTDGEYEVTITLRNDGTDAWTSLSWLWDGNAVVSETGSTGCESLAAGTSGTCKLTNGTYTSSLPDANVAGTHTLMIIGPRNQISGPITC